MADRPIFFMHIAKTAGSFVNHVVNVSAQEGQYDFHIERFLRYKEYFEKEAKEKIFVSGHVYLSDWLDMSKTYSLDFDIMTIIREPFSHIVSHMLWLDHYNQREFRGEFNALDQNTQTVVDRIGAVNFEDPGSLDNFLTHLSPRGIQYLDNCQARYFLCGNQEPIERFQPLTLAMRFAIAKKLDNVAFISTNVEAFVEELGRRLPFPLTVSPEKVNEAKAARRIDINNRMIKRVIEKRILVDLWLYERIVKAGSAKKP